MGAKLTQCQFQIQAIELSLLTNFSRKKVAKFLKIYESECSDGQLNEQRFVQLYNRLTGAKISRQFIQNIFDCIDTNHNGYISFKELMMAYDSICNGNYRQKLEWAFRVYDTEGYGFITEENLVDILKTTSTTAVPVEIIGTMAGKIMMMADDNGDGKLSKHEFIRHVTDCKELRSLVDQAIGQCIEW